MGLNEMQPTSSLKDVMDFKARSEPFTTFIKYPFVEFRRVCLEEMYRNYQDIGSGSADWAEAVIKRLRELNDHDMWKKILEWYLFAAEDELIAIRAVKFALALYYENTVFNDNLVSKLLTGRLKKGFHGIEIYDRLPSVKVFFHGFLRNIYLNKWTEKMRFGEYSESDWRLAMRSLDIAVLARDFSLLWKIEEIIMLIEEGIIFPGQHSHWSAKEMNLTLLKTAEKLLKKAKREAAAGESD